MAQSTFSIRMDETIKQQFDQLCAEFGMTASTAFNIFARTVVRERKIPFEISAPQKTVSLEDGEKAFMMLREAARKNGLQEMTLEEIEKEIQLVRSKREK